MNCFAPSITHSPSSSCARVRVLPASEPASGSVSPKAASLRPAHSSGIHSSFCSARAPEVDRHRAQRGVGGERDADRRVDPRQLLDGERVGERVGAAAAVLLRERDPHQPELAHLRRRSRRETASSRSSSSATGATSWRAKSRTVSLEQPLLVGELEVHRGGHQSMVPAATSMCALAIMARPAATTDALAMCSHGARDAYAAQKAQRPAVHSLAGREREVDLADAPAVPEVRLGKTARRPGSRRACSGCSSAGVDAAARGRARDPRPGRVFRFTDSLSPLRVDVLLAQHDRRGRRPPHARPGDHRQRSPT